MTLPLSSVTTAAAYCILQDAATNLSSYIRMLQADITTGQIPCQNILATLNSALALQSQASAVGADTALVGSMAVYVQQQTGNPTLDVVAEFNASMAALVSLISAIQSDYPKDGNGVLLDRTFSPTGIVTWATLAQSSLPLTTPALIAWQATVS